MGKTCKLKQRKIRRNLKECSHPREIHLQKKFCNLGCLATYGRTTEKQKPQQPMPIQPQKPTEKIQRPAPIIQNNPQRPAQILHSTYAKRTPLPPVLHSLSPITTPKIYSRSRSVNRIGPSPSSSPTHTRTHSETNEVRKPLIGITLCTEPDPSKITDHQLKTILKPLLSFRSINEKNIKPILVYGCSQGDHLCSHSW